MSDADEVARRLAEGGSARSETAVFVRMENGLAVVNIGTSTVTVPCVGFYPPLPGMAVRVDWVNGLPAVTGPVRPLNPLGTITATGTPRAQVTVDGVSYLLYFRSGYTPVLNDIVEINWATGVIQGKVTGFSNPTSPGENGSGSTSFDVVIRAGNSGRYQAGSGWWSNDPRASNSNNGIWTFENRVAESIAGGTVATADVYLPLIKELGNCSIGLHAHPVIPGGAPTISDLVPLALGNRSGWLRLPDGWGAYLAAGGRGIAMTAPGGGDNIWRGTALDGYSGALRFTGTR